MDRWVGTKRETCLGDEMLKQTTVDRSQVNRNASADEERRNESEKEVRGEREINTVGGNHSLAAHSPN